MSYSGLGVSNRQPYDCCAYTQRLQQSVDPLQYQLYFGAQENCGKCVDKKAWFRQDPNLVDLESDLRGQTRPLSKCDQYKYNPNNQTNKYYTNTFDNNVPRILSPGLCPIVYNNIPRQTSVGYVVPDANVCGNENLYTNVDGVNTLNNYNKRTRELVGNSDKVQDINMLMNTCNTQPLYQGGMESVRPYMARNQRNEPVNRMAMMQTVNTESDSEYDE
jgi:hypothetical protein